MFSFLPLLVRHQKLIGWGALLLVTFAASRYAISWISVNARNEERARVARELGMELSANWEEEVARYTSEKLEVAAERLRIDDASTAMTESRERLSELNKRHERLVGRLHASALVFETRTRKNDNAVSFDMSDADLNRAIDVLLGEWQQATNDSPPADSPLPGLGAPR